MCKPDVIKKEASALHGTVSMTEFKDDDFEDILSDARRFLGHNLLRKDYPKQIKLIAN